MHKLIVALIVLTPFIGVSQVSSTSVNPINKVWTLQDDLIKRDSTIGHMGRISYPKRSDTIGAYLLVTTRPSGIVFQKRGFVVIRTVNQYYEEIIYLDCNKKQIKPPYTIWDHQLIIPPK